MTNPSALRLYCTLWLISSPLRTVSSYHLERTPQQYTMALRKTAMTIQQHDHIPRGAGGGSISGSKDYSLNKILSSAAFYLQHFLETSALIYLLVCTLLSD